MNKPKMCECKDQTIPPFHKVGYHEGDTMTKPEPDETELEKIAEQIKEGYVEGKLDTDEGKHIYWKINIEKWEDGND